MENLYTLYYLHKLNTVVNLGVLGKISSYPTYPSAVILKMAMHLEDPELTATISAVPASVADHFGVVRGITQHDGAHPFRQRQFANQIGCRLGRGAVDQALLLAVLARS